MVGGFTVLGGGVLHNVGGKPLNVIVIPEVHKGIVAVAPFGVDQIQHLNDISLFLQQVAGVSQQLSFGVQNHKGGIGLHDVGFGVEAGLTGTGTAADQDIQVPTMLPSVQAQRHLPGQQLVGVPVLLVALGNG